MDLTKHLKQLQALLTSLRKVHTGKKPLKDEALLDHLAKAIDATSALDVAELRSVLAEEVKSVQGRLESSLEHRREDLLKAAREARIPQRRFGAFDRVGFFKVSYKGKKILLEIGSELAKEFEATEGAKILATIEEQRSALDAQPFSREDFFQSVKDAVHLAKEKGTDRDGWVPVRLLHVYVSLLRNLQFADYVKKPASRNFHEYSTAQFVYDLARFGRKDWTCGSEVLRGETPNMATISAGKAMILPNLDDMERLGHQLARVRIEKGAAGGTERSSRKTG